MCRVYNSTCISLPSTLSSNPEHDSDGNIFLRYLSINKYRKKIRETVMVEDFVINSSENQLSRRKCRLRTVSKTNVHKCSNVQQLGINSIGKEKCDSYYLPHFFSLSKNIALTSKILEKQRPEFFKYFPNFACKNTDIYFLIIVIYKNLVPQYSLFIIVFFLHTR